MVLIEMLNNLQHEIGFAQLSTQSQHLLSLDPVSATTFVEQHSKFPIKRQVHQMHV